MYLELLGHLYLYDFKMFLHLAEDTWGFKSVRINDWKKFYVYFY